MKYLKMLGLAVIAEAALAVGPSMASARCYAPPSGDNTNTTNAPTGLLNHPTGVLNDIDDTRKTVTGKTSRTSRALGCTGQTTLRGAVFTRELAANNSISDGQICLA